MGAESEDPEQLRLNLLEAEIAPSSSMGAGWLRNNVFPQAGHPQRCQTPPKRSDCKPHEPTSSSCFHHNAHIHEDAWNAKLKLTWKLAKPHQ